MINESDVEAYLDAATKFMRMPLDAERRPAVKAHLSRIAAFGEHLDAVELSDDVELAGVFTP